MSVIPDNICISCAHFSANIDENLFQGCKAFPKGIPQGIGTPLTHDLVIKGQEGDFVYDRTDRAHNRFGIEIPKDRFRNELFVDFGADDEIIKGEIIFDIELDDELQKSDSDGMFVFRWDIVDDDDIEKGTYVDNPLNKKLGRIGLHYGKEGSFDTLDKPTALKYIGQIEKNMSDKGQMRFIINSDKEYENVLTEISREPNNNIYRLGNGHFEIVKRSNFVEDRDYYNQFVDEPENAIRFIVAKYLKDPLRQTICISVLKTKISKIDKAKVNLTHYSDESGIVHTTKRHYSEQTDFNSPKEMADAVRLVLEDGIVSNLKAKNISIDAQFKEKRPWTILINIDRKDGRFVETAYNFTIDMDNKKGTLEQSLESFLDILQQ